MKVKNDHLLNQARSELAKKELHVESLSKCIGELQRQTEEQRLDLQDSQYGFVESGNEVRELRKSQCKKFRKIQETIQQLTSQLQEMQEQTNSMSHSGDFQDVESNYSGRFSLVSSHLVMIPSPRSMLSLLLDAWNQSGLQENVFGNQFSAFDSPRDQDNSHK